MMQVKLNRYVYLEILRLVALFCVIYNHTDIYGWRYYTTVRGIEMWINLLLACLCKISIPFFLMISGATLLNKQEDISILLRKRVLRMAILIVITSIANYIYMLHDGIVQMDIFEFIRSSFSSFQFCSYYLWMYISFLIVLPFIRSVAQNLSLKTLLYLAFLIILFTVAVPIISVMANFNMINLQIYMYFITALYYYPIFGYFIAHRTEELDSLLQKKSAHYFLGASAVLVIGLHCYLKYMCTFRWNISAETFDSIIGISAIIMFYYMRKQKFFSQRGKGLEKYILWASPNTLGAFLLSSIVMVKLGFIYRWLVLYVSNQLAVLLWVGAIFIVSIWITALLRKIPGVQKIL